MSSSVRRKFRGVSRAKSSKNEENEDKPASSSVSPPPSPSREEEPRPENSTEASKRAGRSKEAQCGSSSDDDDDAEKTLIITVDSEQSCPRQSGKVKGGVKRKREMTETVSQEEEEEDELQPEVAIDKELDRELENKSRQHNLTSANVRSIIHEVITNEHVVAMMKAAINETEPVPLFEPKMTRSKLKEVVEKGVLEEEDSSDEEYHPEEEEEDETAEDSSRKSQHVRVSVVPMGPPPPPQGPEPPRPQTECSFMEKLHAVDEELAIGRLEAELRAPDITPDMYEFGSAPEDREWTRWLQGLMNSDVENEEEGDDDDDPEYNFLADIDEPDVEDYRNDKAVRITKKEVNELMEELFETFQDELLGQDEEGHEEEEDKEEEDNRYRTVKEQLDAIRKRKALLESKGVSVPPKRSTQPTSLYLSPTQKLRLQQHIQQHVQLLTQVNMLSRSVEALQTISCTARQFLSELQFFAQQGEQTQQLINPGFISIFRTCNLQAAVSLLEELDQFPESDTRNSYPVFPGSQIPADLTWLMVTRPVFLYPELLPVIRLRPFNQKGPFTSAETCLVVLGHQHFKGTVNPLRLTCQYLLAARNLNCLRMYIRSACLKHRPNFIKTYFLEGKCPLMPLACEKVCPGDQRVPVERETRLMPRWLSENLKLIHEEVQKYNLHLSRDLCTSKEDTHTLPFTFPPGTRYPPRLPDCLAHTLKPWHLPPPTSCRKKAPHASSSHTTTQSKPTASTEDVEKALSRLPPLLPKFANQNVLNVHSVSKRQKIKSVKNAGKTRAAAGNGTTQNQGKLVITLPTAPVTSSRETLVSGSCAGTVVQANVIIALPTALIDPTPSATLVCQTPSSFSPLIKEHMSQRCGTLLKLSVGQRSNLNPLTGSSQFFLLPPGCIIASSPNVNRDDRQKSGVDQEAELQDRDGPLENFPEDVAFSQASNSEENNVQETDETESKSHEKDLECGCGVFEERFLTLSESSGSPSASLYGEDDAMETVDNVKEHRASQTSTSKQQNDQPSWTEGEDDEREDALMLEEESRIMSDLTSLASIPSKLSIADLQESMEKLSKMVSDPEEKRLSEEEKTDHRATDDDPQREVKDVAFAQAYLEKVCEALQVVPGKVEDFLSVLYEFESNPDSRTAVELFMRLKPVLRDWPELLRDFAAFLHPEQARECGLLEEQQAFERSRRFLRQLERHFGEHSMHYRRVVRTLQQGLPESRRGSEETKAQIALLFRDHPNLLKEYWLFYKHLHSTIQRMSDDEDEEDEMETDSMNNVTEHQRLEKEADQKKKNTDIIILSTRNCSTRTEMMDMQSRDDAQMPVCAKNSSWMPSGEKVVLWTREADRVILTACQQSGASQSTFTSIAAQLGNKTATEVDARYQDLIKLFHKSTQQHYSTEDHSVLAGRSDVMELNDSDFDYIAAEQETMLVKFYAPWCGHCKKLAPEFEAAATRLKGIATLAKVDCTSNTEVCKRFEVTGYPILKIFRNGVETSTYDGPRSSDGIVDHIKKQAGPDSRLLHNENDLEAFINHFDASIVGVFESSSSPQLVEFLKGASLMRDSFRFAHTTDMQLGHKHQLTSDYGICPHLTKENKDQLRKRDLMTVYYDLDYLHNPKGSNYWRNRVLKVVSQYKDHGLHYSVANRQDFKDELEEDYGLGTTEGSDMPFVTIRTRLGHKYTMREEFTRDGKSLERFLEDYFAGRLKRYVKSEPVPANNKEPVKVVVADTFEEIVNDAEKDVLIEFYAPWCGHCKKLEPKYTELAQQLYNDPNIVIAKMDATANDVPQGYDVEGFPTIYFVPALRKDEPRRYEGGREVKDFLSFLKREATNPLVLKGAKEEL
ncbi:Protein disulfide-isomerase A3 [Bagarius yarrelli]|uniref:CASP8-associated protein 2 n=1 Tax=Bagarius yarrelli TaxID=175774 RepID=A0A556TP11_BAGYA|nr:Protein disulfide-isomerase A3 [Bagarius yarrelli]